MKALLYILFSLFLILPVVSQQKASPDSHALNKRVTANWGMSNRDVKNIFSNTKYSSDAVLGYETELFGKKCELAYYFQNDKLIAGKYIFYVDREYVNEYDNLKKLINEQYSLPSLDTIIHNSNEIKYISNWNNIINKTTNVYLYLTTNYDYTEEKLSVELWEKNYDISKKYTDSLELVKLNHQLDSSKQVLMQTKLDLLKTLNEKYLNKYFYMSDKVRGFKKFEKIKISKILTDSIQIQYNFELWQMRVQKEDKTEVDISILDNFADGTLVKNNPLAKFNKVMQELIKNGKIRIGMTKEQARLSWGEPNSINRTVGSWGVHEQWVWEYKYSSNTYLYFENGILTSFQD